MVITSRNGENYFKVFFSLVFYKSISISLMPLGPNRKMRSDNDPKRGGERARYIIFVETKGTEEVKHHIPLK